GCRYSTHAIDEPNEGDMRASEATRELVSRYWLLDPDSLQLRTQDLTFEPRPLTAVSDQAEIHIFPPQRFRCVNEILKAVSTTHVPGVENRERSRGERAG